MFFSVPPFKTAYQQNRLVESPLFKSFSVQGNWQDHLHCAGAEMGFKTLEQQMLQNSGHRQSGLIFQQVNTVFENPLILRHGTDPVQIQRRSNTGFTQMRRSRCHRQLKTTPTAIGVGDGEKSAGSAQRTKTGVQARKIHWPCIHIGFAFQTPAGIHQLVNGLEDKMAYLVQQWISTPLAKGLIHGDTTGHRGIERVDASPVGKREQKITFLLHQRADPFVLTANDQGNVSGEICCIQ